MHITNPPKPDLQTSTDDALQVGLARVRAQRQRRQKIIGGGLVVVAVAALALTQTLMGTPAVSVVPVKAQATERVLAVTGRVKPRETVQVFSRTSGQIIALSKDEGDMVKAGDVLGQIDPARAKTTLAQANAALEAQRRTVAQAERDLDRARALLQRGSTTATNVESAVLALSKGQDELRRLAAARDDAKLRIDELAVIAPFDGRILNRPVDPGQVVDAKTTLFEIAPILAQEVETEVDETYSMALTLGQEARLAFAGIPATVVGRVSYLAPEIQTSTGGRIVRLSFTAPETASGNELPVGLSVDVNIIVDRDDNAITVPRQYVRDIATAPYVLTIADGKLTKRDVTIIDWPAASVIVTSGLAAGDKVVSTLKTPAIGAKVKAES